MKKWEEEFKSLSEEELNKIAILRLVECTNGVIQHAFREQREWALSLEETRRVMKYSMSCMKTMSIPLHKETITFSEDTSELMREVRELYISGFKNGNDDDFEEFMSASKACLSVIGEERILKAKEIVETQIEEIKSEYVNWGLDYIKSLMNW